MSEGGTEAEGGLDLETSGLGEAPELLVGGPIILLGPILLHDAPPNIRHNSIAT